MWVYIRTAEGRSFRLPVPIWFVRFGLNMTPYAMKLGGDHIDDSVKKVLAAIDFKLLSQSFKELKQFKGEKIIQVKTSTGEEVEITL